MNYSKEKTLFAIVTVIVLTLSALFVFHDVNQTKKDEGKITTPLPPPVTETTLFFAGDIMLSREVHGKIKQANDVNLPYKNVLDDIKSASLSFANLESPFNNLGTQSENRLVFKAEPNTVTGLVNAGFDILSTANNHAFDQGRDAVNYTHDWLIQNGIKPLGTGLNCHDGVIMEENGIKFGFLGYSYAAFNDGGAIPDPLVCDWNDLAQMSKDVTLIKSKVDFLIVSAHFGKEYERRPSSQDAASARALVDAGADMFIGHHPHWVQTIEEYKGKYIFYSLGNFVFDQMWSQDTQEGLTVEVLFKDKNVSRIKLKPVVIENFCCPRWADTTETKNILNKINPNYASPTLFENGQTASDWLNAVSQKFQLRTP